MKTPAKVLCAAVLAVLATALPAQSSMTTATPVGTFTTPPSHVASDTTEGSMVILEDSVGWVLDLQHLGASETVLFFAGASEASSVLALGAFGDLSLDIANVFFVAVAGDTSSAGHLMVSLDRPKQLDPALEGFKIMIQCFSVDYESATGAQDFTPANPGTITLTSVL